MSGTYLNFFTSEDDWTEWQPYVMPYPSLNHRAPPPGLPPHWVVVERDRVEGERQMAARLGSSSSSAPSHFPEQRYDTSRNTYPTYRRTIPDSPPRFYEPPYSPPYELGSSLTQEEQEKALKNMRKVMYNPVNPHLSNIVRRLGMKHSTNGTNQSSTSGSSREEEDKRCAICLDDFKSKEFVMVTPCNHMFHEECIVPWVKSQGKCPVCRSMIYEKKKETRENNSRRAARGREVVPILWQFNRGL